MVTFFLNPNNYFFIYSKRGIVYAKYLLQKWQVLKLIESVCLNCSNSVVGKISNKQNDKIIKVTSQTCLISFKYTTMFTELISIFYNSNLHQLFYPHFDQFQYKNWKPYKYFRVDKSPNEGTLPKSLLLKSLKNKPKNVILH